MGHRDRNVGLREEKRLALAELPEDGLSRFEHVLDIQRRELIGGGCTERIREVLEECGEQDSLRRDGIECRWHTSSCT